MCRYVGQMWRRMCQTGRGRFGWLFGMKPLCCVNRARWSSRLAAAVPDGGSWHGLFWAEMRMVALELFVFSSRSASGVKKIKCMLAQSGDLCAATTLLTVFGSLLCVRGHVVTWMHQRNDMQCARARARSSLRNRHVTVTHVGTLYPRTPVTQSTYGPQTLKSEQTHFPSSHPVNPFPMTPYISP